ncbi:AfsR/SARP family transcriptional regulator [Nocardioides sp. AE5]|uniref:AfsR/SARP family transcriptional regulator n=1 Tax=Nocardioides sp. AE5 TaxID=2962573 RepID=UPI002880ECF2|nr:AfsR/SARP family transcriptional regulator [Nocardioides sp. AE5]MDT0200479.1 AfsR/SARP family transcriptional regulator [Nocardioides sp. AE5]
MVLDVFVLGSMRATLDGQGQRVRGDKQRALLALLVLAQGREVPAKQLIAELWPATAPRNPGHALQAQVSRLRSAPGVEIDFLDHGYRVDPATFHTDATRFEDLCEQAGWLLAEGARAESAECLREALGLWRGDAFEGLHEIVALQLESARLARLRQAALSDRVDLDLAMGRASAVVDELHVLVGEQPLLERHWSQLLTALYATGKAPQALDAFSRAREVFVDRLGVEPSGELRALHLKILREEPPAALLRFPVETPVLSAGRGRHRM